MLIEDREYGLWVVAYTERVLRMCASLLMDMYTEYRLWVVPIDIIGFARGHRYVCHIGIPCELPGGSRTTGVNRVDLIYGFSKCMA